MNNYYFDKYLKYKSKYCQLKSGGIAKLIQQSKQLSLLDNIKYKDNIKQNIKLEQDDNIKRILNQNRMII